MSDEKITILNLIKENKDILFGKFSSTLTHEIKTKRWIDIAEKAKAVGIFEKDWKYLRDTTWQNWRKRTIEKKDRRMKTGSEGGKKFVYDESDKIILEIIGKDSPLLEGLSIPETCGKDMPTTNTVIEIKNGLEDQVNKSNNESLCEDNATAGCSGSFIKPKRIKDQDKRKRTVKFVDSDLLDLKKRKIKEQTMLFEAKREIALREKYKLDLELFKLENELGVPPSKFTELFYGITYEMINNGDDAIETSVTVDGFEDSESSLQNINDTANNED